MIHAKNGTSIRVKPVRFQRYRIRYIIWRGRGELDVTIFRSAGPAVTVIPRGGRPVYVCLCLCERSGNGK